MWQALFRLPATVWLLGLVSLCNDTASELIYPLVPLYLASVLMATPRALGIIEGIAEATGSLLKLVSGSLTDRTGTAKPWLLTGYGLAAIGRPLIALATSWPLVAVLRFADGLCKGLRSAPRDAMLARAAPPERRGLAFGLHRAMDNAGAVIGPLLAAWLLAAHVPLQRVFIWALLPGVLTIALTLAIREPVTTPTDSPPAIDWTLRGMPGPFKRYLATLALFTIGNASNMFLLLRAHDLGLSTAEVPLAWALVSLVAMAFSTPLSALTDRIGRIRMIIAGWTIYGLFYLLLGFDSDSPQLLWPLFAGYGLYLAATEGAEKSLVADLAPAGQLGTAYGWFNLISGLLLLPASILFGGLWQSVGPGIACGFSATCALGAALLLATWVGHSRNAPRPAGDHSQRALN